MLTQLKSNVKTGLMLVAIFIAIRAFATPIYKYLTGSLHPFMLDVYISLAGIIVLGVFLGWQVPQFSALRREDKLDFFKLTIISMVGALSLDLAIFYLPVKAFMIFISFLPIVVSFYSSFLLKEQPSKLLWLAAILATAGAIIFKSQEFSFGVGDLLVLVGILLFAVYPIVSRKYVHKIGEYELYLIDSSLYLPVAAGLAAVLGVVALPPLNFNYTLIFVFSVFAVFNLAGLLAVAATRHLPAHTFVTLTTALVPIGAIAISVFALGETIGLHEIIGGAVMISAAVLAAWYSNNK